MSLSLTGDHRALEDVARRYLATVEALTLARRATDGSAVGQADLWSGMVAQGWQGLHVSEKYGGQGYGYAELAIVLAELGRVAAPGGFTASAVVAAVIEALGSDEQKQTHLADLATGVHVAAIALDFEPSGSEARPWDSLAPLCGSSPAAVGGSYADRIAVAVGADVVLIEVGADGLTVSEIDAIDRTLGITKVGFDAVEVNSHDIISGAARLMRMLALVFFAADAAGIAQATLEASVQYAKTRVQFGRPIGSFQAVKHHCANMAVKAELATAAVWDAARSSADDEDFEFVTTAAAAAALDAAKYNAQMNIQIHGGIGFTWEHDAHLYLRRAVAISQLFGPAAPLNDAIHDLASGGARRAYTVALPPEADDHRADVRRFIEHYATLSGPQARALAVETGYLVPHWPRPFGRAAGAVEQLVIDEELKGVTLPRLGIGAWVLQTLVEHGTPDQIERWVRPSLMGDYVWCQLFSEPGAGSDASAITTKAVKVEGGWSVTGQKVWTSGAHESHLGIATVLTDPKAAKRKGISMVVVDLHAPGVTVRPLKELTGLALFNEVFLDSVFVSDGDVVGEVGEGWAIARATLGNERVSIGDGAHRGITAYELIDMLAASPFAGDAAMQQRIGALVVEEHSMRLLGLRRVARVLAAAESGNEGSIGKLLSAEHWQQTGGLALEFGGRASALGGIPRVSFEYLFGRCLTIGGGTSEISRNVIAERLLGLPREPSLN